MILCLIVERCVHIVHNCYDSIIIRYVMYYKCLILAIYICIA